MKPAERLFGFQCLLREHLFGRTDSDLLADRLIRFLGDRAYQWDRGSLPILSENLGYLLPSVLKCDFAAFDVVRQEARKIWGKKQAIPSREWAEYTILHAAEMVWQYEFGPALSGTLALSPEGWLISAFCITLGGLSSLSWQVHHAFAMFLLNCRSRVLQPETKRALAAALPDVLAETNAIGFAVATLWVILLARAIDHPVRAEAMYRYSLQFREDHDQLSGRVDAWVAAASDAQYWQDFADDLGRCVQSQAERKSVQEEVVSTLKVLRQLLKSGQPKTSASE